MTGLTQPDDITTSNDKQKAIHVRIDANVRDAINAVVRERGLKTQKEAIELAINALKLGCASEVLPEKEQAITEISNLFNRIIAKVADSFYVINDARLEYKARASMLEKGYDEELARLKAENDRLTLRCQQYENTLAMFGKQFQNAQEDIDPKRSTDTATEPVRDFPSPELEI